MPGEPVEALRLLAEAAAMPNGPTKIAVLEEATRRADLGGDLELAFRARTELASAAEFGGSPEKTLVTFAWLLARIDEHPGRFNEWQTLWTYKWAVTSLVEFATVPMSEVESAIADLEARFIRQGAGPRAAAKLRWRVARAAGDAPEARRWLDVWRGTQRDFLSDCAACDAGERAECQLFLGDVEGAIETAAPIFAGRLRCAEVPHNTYADFLLPLLDRDDRETAKGYHERGYELIRRNPEFLQDIGDHIAYLTLVGALGRATALLERHLSWAVPVVASLGHVNFLLGARLLLDALAATSDVVIRVPDGFGGESGARRIPSHEARAVVDEELDRLVAAFDRRNGNDHYTRVRSSYDARSAEAST